VPQFFSANANAAQIDDRLAAAVVVVALALAAGGSARADVCVVINPVLDIGCRDVQGAPAEGNRRQARSRRRTPRTGSLRRGARPSCATTRTVSRDLQARVARRAGRCGDLRCRRDARAGHSKINAYSSGWSRSSAPTCWHRCSRRSGGERVEGAIAEAFDTSPDDTTGRTGRLAGCRLPQAWDVTQGSSKIIVAVIDTGVDANHPDLRGALVPGWNFIGNNANPSDDHGHGTAVAGVIAARSNNHVGGAGVCWRARHADQALDSKGSGDDTLIAAGIVWAVDHGAQVINLSLGGPGSSVELANALAYASAKGVVVLAAAGNAGDTTQFYPAADPHAVSVAATTVATTATRGRTSGRGCGSPLRVANIAPILGGGYGTFCGTSSATPVVAGLAALELSAQPQRPQVKSRTRLRAPPFAAGVRAVRPHRRGKTLALLRPAAAKSAVFRGVVGPRVRSRTYSLDLGAGPFTAVLRFTAASGSRFPLLSARLRAADRFS